jgi:hypothetical protein
MWLPTKRDSQKRPTTNNSTDDYCYRMSTIVHVILFYGRDIVARTRNARFEEADVHLKLMRKYREAPEWWFATVFLISFAFGMVACQVWDTHLTWWAYIICILIGAVLILPVGIIQAITNQQTGLNVITEMIVGYMLPGQPIAMMLFKSWGYMLAYNGLQYVQDMKITHYSASKHSVPFPKSRLLTIVAVKIPPRTVFAAQLFAVVWLSIVQIAAYNFLRGNIEGICTSEQINGLTCPNAKTFYNASVIWGVLGPAKMFGAGQLFAWTNWFWLIGAILPVIQYFLALRYPRSFLRYVFWPAIFGAASMIPPATPWYIVSQPCLFAMSLRLLTARITQGCWVVVGLTFNYWVKSKWFGWWSKLTNPCSVSLSIWLISDDRSLQLCPLRRTGYWHRPHNCHFGSRPGSQRCQFPRLVGNSGVAEQLGCRRHSCNEDIGRERSIHWARRMALSDDDMTEHQRASISCITNYDTTLKFI